MAIVPAAEQTLAVLRYLGRQAGPTQAAAISRDLELPRSTTYHLLDTLTRSGFVVHLPEQRRYVLGVAAYELGSGYSRQASLQRVARGPVAALVDRLGHNAHLAILHGRDVVYVIEERAPGRPPLITDVGVRLPAHITASGRAMLALLPQAQLRTLYPDAASFELRRELGPGSLSALRALLVTVRARGHADEDGEVSAGFASVAVAVADSAGHPAAAVAVTFPSDSVGDGERSRILVQVLRTTAELARRLGTQA